MSRSNSSTSEGDWLICDLRLRDHRRVGGPKLLRSRCRSRELKRLVTVIIEGLSACETGDPQPDQMSWKRLISCEFSIFGSYRRESGCLVDPLVTGVSFDSLFFEKTEESVSKSKGHEEQPAPFGRRIASGRWLQVETFDGDLRPVRWRDAIDELVGDDPAGRRREV